MNIEISTVVLKYSDNGVDGVEVNFSGSTADSNISVRRKIDLTYEEYQGNEPKEKLKRVVRQKLAEIILNEDGEDEPENAE